MSEINSCYDAEKDMSRPCACGKHHSKAAHDADAATDAEKLSQQVVESAMVRALFPDDRERRRISCAQWA